jgi:hypothetical protein
MVSGRLYSPQTGSAFPSVTIVVHQARFMSGLPNYDPTWKQPPPQQPGASAIGAFAGLNFAFAGISLIGALLMGGVLIYGIFFSGDQGSDLAAGIAGSLVVAAPAVIGVIVYSLAGFGLLRRRAWGYYFHLAGAVLAALTCIGVIYTIVAFVFASRPEFSASFFPSTAQRWEVGR